MIPEGGSSTYILHLSGFPYIKEQDPDPFPKKFEFGSSSGSQVKNATFCKGELNLIFVYWLTILNCKKISVLFMIKILKQKKKELVWIYLQLTFLSKFIFSPGSGSGCAFWIRIRIQLFKWIRIIRNHPDPDLAPDPQLYALYIIRYNLMGSY
jgi:hypothetical protein